MVLTADLVASAQRENVSARRLGRQVAPAVCYVDVTHTYCDIRRVVRHHGDSGDSVRSDWERQVVRAGRRGNRCGGCESNLKLELSPDNSVAAFIRRSPDHSERTERRDERLPSIRRQKVAVGETGCVKVLVLELVHLPISTDNSSASRRIGVFALWVTTHERRLLDPS